MSHSPPHGHRLRASTVVPMSMLGVVGLLLACGQDSPVVPPAVTPDRPMEAAAARGGGDLRYEDEALSVEAMLGDPLFQALVQGIEAPSLAEPVLAAVDALASGQTARATSLIGRASAAAEELEDGPTVESLVLWSAVVRFLEEAELI